MYGLLIESIADFTKRVYGNVIWENVRKKARIDHYTFSSHQQYSETLMLKLLKCLAEVTGEDINELMESLGVEFVDFVGRYGYDRILKVLGRHMRDFLNGLDNLHEYMRFSYHKLKPPSFFVEKESATGLILHYRSKRKGFLYYVRGQIKAVGKIFYNLDVKIEVLSDKIEGELTHVVFQLFFKNDQYIRDLTNSSASMTSLRHKERMIDSNLPIRSETFFELFPFHVVFKKNLVVVSIGDGLAQAMKHAEGERITDLFNLIRPLVAFTWDNIISHTNNVFEITTIEPIRRSSSPTNEDEPKERKIVPRQSSTEFDEHLKLKGQMLYVTDWDAIIFLATPVLENLELMFNTGFYINDLSMHDSSRDLVLVGTQQSAELKLALDQEKTKSKALEDSMKKLDVEMKRTDQLLYQMIPKKIADRLRSGEAVMNLCEVVSSCTILFSDVVGFTSTCSQLSPMEVVSMLNTMYTKFDKCLEQHDVYKVETIGDAYMVVSGLPERTNNHAVEIVEYAFDMLNAIATIPNPATGEPMRIRVGCHSGPVVAGVVGLKMPRYCLFGDTVNTASRMESTSEAMKIHISQSTKAFIQGKYKIVERGKLEVKGKGEMKTFFVLAKLDADGKSIKCPFTEVIEEYQRKHGVDLNERKMKTEEKETFVLANGEVQADDAVLTSSDGSSEKLKTRNDKKPIKQDSIDSADNKSLRTETIQPAKAETTPRKVDPIKEESTHHSHTNGSVKNHKQESNIDDDIAKLAKLRAQKNAESHASSQKENLSAHQQHPEQLKTVTCNLI